MNSVHSDLFYGMYENFVLMNTLQQITSPYPSSHKSYYIFKLGPLLFNDHVYNKTHNMLYQLQGYTASH